MKKKRNFGDMKKYLFPIPVALAIAFPFIVALTPLERPLTCVLSHYTSVPTQLYNNGMIVTLYGSVTGGKQPLLINLHWGDGNKDITNTSDSSFQLPMTHNYWGDSNQGRFTIALEAYDSDGATCLTFIAVTPSSF